MKNIGSDFSDFLKEEGIYDEVESMAVKRVIAYQVKQKMKLQKGRFRANKTCYNHLKYPRC